MTTTPDLDYDVLRYETGALFLSNYRSASYSYDGKGHVLIHLESKTEVHDGWKNQADKAYDICRIWIETGEVTGLMPIPDGAQ